MDLRVFHDRIYAKYQSQLYTFEPTWDSFRPIEKVGWDGKQYSVVDAKYKTDLFSEFYGYESSEQKRNYVVNLLKQLSLKMSQKLQIRSNFGNGRAKWKQSGFAIVLVYLQVHV